MPDDKAKSDLEKILELASNGSSVSVKSYQKSSSKGQTVSVKAASRGAPGPKSGITNPGGSLRSGVSTGRQANEAGRAVSTAMGSSNMVQVGSSTLGRTPFHPYTAASSPGTAASISSGALNAESKAASAGASVRSKAVSLQGQISKAQTANAAKAVAAQASITKAKITAATAITKAKTAAATAASNATAAQAKAAAAQASAAAKAATAKATAAKAATPKTTTTTAKTSTTTAKTGTTSTGTTSTGSTTKSSTGTTSGTSTAAKPTTSTAAKPTTTTPKPTTTTPKPSTSSGSSTGSSLGKSLAAGGLLHGLPHGGRGGLLRGGRGGRGGFVAYGIANALRGRGGSSSKKSSSTKASTDVKKGRETAARKVEEHKALDEAAKLRQAHGHGLHHTPVGFHDYLAADKALRAGKDVAKGTTALSASEIVKLQLMLASKGLPVKVDGKISPELVTLARAYLKVAK